jgi:hypothetical protein
VTVIGTDVQNTTLANKGPSRREMIKQILVDRIKQTAKPRG